MICGFKQKFPWGEPTNFREKILMSVIDAPAIIIDDVVLSGKIPGLGHLHAKLHTIRAGNRWKAGDRIHMAYGVRTKNYQCFNEGIPELETVKSVQSIEIIHYTVHMKPLEIMGFKGGSSRFIVMKIDGKYYGGYRQVAINDGFEDVDQFYKWFKKDFSGQILHWTDLRY